MCAGCVCVCVDTESTWVHASSLCVCGGGRRFGHKRPNNEAHFQALRNLLHPGRVVEAAKQVCKRGGGMSCI